MLPGRSYFYLSESADYERDQDRESPEQDQLSTTQVDDQELSLYSGEGPSSLAAAGLAKGQACSQCRAGKRKCDGAQPACGRCKRQRRDCTYKSSTYSRARTKDLLETVGTLEARLEELQLKAGRDASSLSDKPRKEEELLFCPEDSPVVTLMSASSSHRPVAAKSGSVISMSSKASTARSSLPRTPTEWWLQDPIPPIMQKRLLDTFMAHKERPQFYFHLPRFWASLSRTSPPASPTVASPPPPPGLLFTMYLVACFWSGDSSLRALEPHFLTKARECQAESLRHLDIMTRDGTIVQWFQASAMLTYYLAACTNRFLEARQEISGTIPLLLRCGLHKIRSSSWQDLQHPSPSETPTFGLGAPSVLPPAPQDNIEVGERICIFWMFYAVEIMTSLVAGLAPNRELVDQTSTVWPREFGEYEQVSYYSSDGHPSDLFRDPTPPPFDPPCSSYALRCKALVLLARVSTFATSSTAEYIRTPEFRTRFVEFHQSLNTFLDGLPPVHSNPWPSTTPSPSPSTEASSSTSPTTPSSTSSPVPPAPNINVPLVAIHTLALFSYIQLFDAAGLESDVFTVNRLYDRRLAVARRAALLVRAFLSSGIPVATLPAICTCCWYAVARVLAVHFRRIQESARTNELLGLSSETDVREIESVQTDLSTMLEAMAVRSAIAPVWGVMVERIRAYVQGESDESELATNVAQMNAPPAPRRTPPT